jgi:hypothetical protein
MDGLDGHIAEKVTLQESDDAISPDLLLPFLCTSNGDGSTETMTPWPCNQGRCQALFRGHRVEHESGTLMRLLQDDGPPIGEPHASLKRARRLALVDTAAAVKVLTAVKAKYGDRNCGSAEWEESCNVVAGREILGLECTGKDPAGADSRAQLLERLNSAIRNEDVSRARTLMRCMFTIGMAETDFIWTANGQKFARNLVGEASKDNWVFVPDRDGFRVNGKHHYVETGERNGRYHVVGFSTDDRKLAGRLTPVESGRRR